MNFYEGDWKRLRMGKNASMVERGQNNLNEMGKDKEKKQL